MSFITYKQYDSRWGKKNYNGSSNMATAGCGPTSVAMLAYAVDGKTTPIDTMKFMQKNGYAIRNNGTAWAGIPAAIKHFGLTNVKNLTTMPEVWSYLSKDNTCAVFLFSGGSRGGVTWTTAGHYVAVTDYKTKDGKHYLYTRDSGGRGHTGWYCYETQMKGLIPQIWCGTVPKKEKSKKTVTKGDKILAKAEKCAWPIGTKEEVWAFKGGKPKKAYKQLLDKVFPKHKKWKKQIRTGASCAVYAAAVVKATVDKAFPCNDPVKQLVYLKKSSKWEKVKFDKAKPGDLIIYKKSKGSAGHIMIYRDKKTLCEASYAKAYPHVKKIPKKFKTADSRKKHYTTFAVYRRK